MNCNISVSSYFSTEAKRLSKKYPSFVEDLKSFQKSLLENPDQGVLLAPGIRKIRLAIKSKGKGKSGGARVITYTLVSKDEQGIVLLLIYDKEDASSVKTDVVKRIIADLNL